MTLDIYRSFSIKLENAKRFDAEDIFESAAGCSSRPDTSIGSKSPEMPKLKRRRFSGIDVLDSIENCSSLLDTSIGSKSLEELQLKRRRFSGTDITSDFSKRPKLDKLDSKKRPYFENKGSNNGSATTQFEKLDGRDEHEEVKPSPFAEQSFKLKSESVQICNICYRRPKDATFVHGKISHQICCYPCAKAIFKQHRSCPVCRRKIEKITKIFA